jgi:RNA-directed DNA polymerase
MELIEEVLSKENMRKAYFKVVRNKGSAGVDGMKVEELKPHLQKHWHTVKERILAGQYQPQAVKGKALKKRSGGTRMLGIPTVTDRMIQQAIHQVLSPLWEPEFSQYSYGFRPGKSAQQAVAQAQMYINEGYQDIIDLDLKSFFDVVNQDFLMSLIHRKVKDPLVLKMIRRYLKAGMLAEGVLIERTTGTPQGSPLSPLLSNIILHELDKELTRRKLRFVRYADDCSMFLHSRRAAFRVKRSITEFIEGKLKLKVNNEKTKICRPVNFVLLSYSFVPTYKKDEIGKYNLRVSPDSIELLKEKVKAITRKTSSISFAERITELSYLTRGWVNYFRLATMKGKLHEIDSWTRNRLRYCIWKQWKKPKRRKRAFIQLGIDEDHARAWSYSRMGGWRIAQSPIMVTTITLERLKRRGYISFDEVYTKLVV